MPAIPGMNSRRRRCDQNAGPCGDTDSEVARTLPHSWHDHQMLQFRQQDVLGGCNPGRLLNRSFVPPFRLPTSPLLGEKAADGSSDERWHEQLRIAAGWRRRKSSDGEQSRLQAGFGRRQVGRESSRTGAQLPMCRAREVGFGQPVSAWQQPEHRRRHSDLLVASESPQPG